MLLNAACKKAERLAKKDGYKNRVFIHQVSTTKYDAGFNEYRTPGVLYCTLTPRKEVQS